MHAADVGQRAEVWYRGTVCARDGRLCNGVSLGTEKENRKRNSSYTDVRLNRTRNVVLVEEGLGAGFGDSQQVTTCRAPTADTASSLYTHGVATCRLKTTSRAVTNICQD